MVDDTLPLIESASRAQFKAYLGLARGIVGTHGREEMLADIDGVEVNPRKTLEYRGVPREMNFDAVRAPRPDVGLVLTQPNRSEP